MIWRLATFFKRLLVMAAPACLAIACAGAATVGGEIRLVDSDNPSVIKKADYSGVVVWLETTDATAALRPTKQHAAMLQKNKKFVPHILPIETGTSVDFPNLDLIFHNAFSNFNGQIFDVALYPPGTSRSVKFDRPGVVRVFCNIHPTMSAVILVLNSRYFAESERHGEYKIENVPSGTYDVHFFHERATEEALDRLTRRVTISGDTHLLPVSISEAGYLPVPHKNKYGQDYSAANEDADSYKAPLK